MQLLCRQQTSYTDLQVSTPLDSFFAHFLKSPLPIHTATWQISEIYKPHIQISPSLPVLSSVQCHINWSCQWNTLRAGTASNEVLSKIDSIHSPKQCPSCRQPDENQIVVVLLPWTVLSLQQNPIHPNRKLSVLLKDLIPGNSLYHSLSTLSHHARSHQLLGF